MNIGDLFLRLVAEDAGFSKEVERKAGAAGDKAGQTMGQRIGAKLRAAAPAMLAGVGAAAAVAFTAGTTQLVRLDSAMADFRAETGATTDEVRSASDAVLEFSRRNLAGIDEIAATMAALRTDMGLTQQAAEDMTEPFLDFALATGQEGADAVRQFDDILDGFNLDASESQSIMDKLIASHQEYGGSVAENADALGRLAPQLNGLGLSLDDGIGLLNLFAASGLDASKASFALNTAVRQLEPGQTFDDLIAEISAIEDPTLRAQRAIEIFGSRGGVDLANALRPGITSLADFSVSQEEAQGATQEAADAINDSWANRVKLWISNVAGLSAEFLQNFGPAISGVGALVPVLAGPLGGLFKTMGAGTLTVIPALIGSLGKVGGALTMLATGPVGIIVAAVAGLFIAWQTNFLGIRDIVSNVFGWIQDVALPWIGGVFDAIASAIGAAVGVITGVIGGIADVVSSVANAIAGFFSWIFGETDKANARINSVRDNQRNWQPSSAVTSSASQWERERQSRSYDVGAWSVPSTGPALLHAREMVIPPGPAQALRDWFGGRFDHLVPAAAPAGGGDVFNINVAGLMRARSTDEIGAGLKRLSRAGALTRRRRYE